MGFGGGKNGLTAGEAGDGAKPEIIAGYEKYAPPFDQFREWRPKHKFRSGAIYHGQWNGNKRDGYGSQTWPQDGARYDGMLDYSIS